MPSALRIQGIRFGKLTALRPLPERRGGAVVWLCRCKCGNLTKQETRDLMRGHTVSCGCALREYRYFRRRLAIYCRRNMTIVEIWKTGVTMRAIARHLGIHHGRVARIVGRHIKETLTLASATEECP